MPDITRHTRALVLFSGGQDSTTCLAHALDRFEHVETLGFDYGQRHHVELQARLTVLRELRERFPQWATRLGDDHVLDLAVLGAVSDTSLTRDMAFRMEASGLPNTFVPGRNLLFLTLAAALAYRRGLTVLVTKSTNVALTTEGTAKSLFGDFISFGGLFPPGQLQVIVVWWLILTAFYIYFLHYSRYGNWILAMGGDKVSARNAGIPTDRMTILLFVFSAVSAAFVGMCQAILYNSAQVAGGQSFIFNSIIAVVVGGVLLTGGFGSVVGIFFGTITFAIVNQGIYYTDFDRNWSALIIGILLLLAVLMNNTFRKMALSYSPKKGAK